MQSLLTNQQVKGGRGESPEPLSGRADAFGGATGPMFTYREFRAIELVSKGMKNAEIGIAMGVTESTVKNVFRVVLDKLGFSNRVEVALWYTRRQWEWGRLTLAGGDCA